MTDLEDLVKRLLDWSEPYSGVLRREAAQAIQRLSRELKEAREENVRLREALVQSGTVCADNSGETCNHKMALTFVGQVIRAILSETPHRHTREEGLRE